MKLFKLCPPFAPPSLSRLLPFCLFSFSLIVVTANNGYAQSSSERPVARLITATRDSATYPPPRRDSATYPARPRTVSASSNMEIAAASPVVSAMSDERKAFDLVNAERRARGERPLVWDAELARMARSHSENMARRNFFNHKGPDGQGLRERSQTNGITGFRALAENLAFNKGFTDSASCAVVGWMRSEGHRANILNDEFTRSGIGMARSSDGRVYFTQVFVAR